MKNKKEQIEDTTKYGEFVSTYFAWVAPEKQKSKAEELSKITKKENMVDNNS